MSDKVVLSYSKPRVVTWGEPTRVVFQRQIRLNLFGLRFAFVLKLYSWES